MHRHNTLTPATDAGASRADRWSFAVRDVVADLQPLSIDDLLDFAEVIA